MSSDDANKAHLRAVFYLGIGAMGFFNARWFNSAEPQRSYYKFYIAILILAQFLGSRAGQRMFEDSQRKPL